MNPAAIVKLFQPEFASIARRYGADTAISIATQIDQGVDAEARQAPPGSTITVKVDWHSIEARLAGQTVAATRAEKAEAQVGDVIQLTPDGLAKIVAAARAEPGKTIDFEYDNYGETGKVTRIRQRPTP